MPNQSDQIKAEPLIIKRDFNVPVAEVYAAWSNPDLFKQWVWASLGKNTTAEIDFQVKGKYTASTDRPENQKDDPRTRWNLSGIYTEIKPNHRIAGTLKWSAPMGYGEPPENLIVEFVEAANKANTSQMTFTHQGVPDPQALDAHGAGWSEAFDYLERLLEK